MICERKDQNTLSHNHILGPLKEKKDAGKKILFLSLGTIVNVVPMFQPFLAQAYDAILSAIAKLDNVHAVLSVGPNMKLFAGKTLPPNVEVYPFVPQLEVPLYF
jgi:UDP:flavonoid glycosyltransferase YjiC (YdhE family)